MGIAPYHRSYQRARPSGATKTARYPRNPAGHLTDQGADPDPADLAWRICHEWRVIYYSARQAEGLPLWPGADAFEVVMAGILFRLSRGFEPIAPVHSREAAAPKDGPTDLRQERVYQPSCRVFRTPVFDREWEE